ncbi:MAG: MFS transporter [Chloroflexi bacterium]|nr:MFS transporter [Chloroflexota bacterium]
MDKGQLTAERPVLGVSRNVFFLGWVSLLTDVSSEMVLTVLPLFLTNVLGVKTSVVGLIEGVADSTSTLSRLPSGWLSDRLRRRKTLTLVGYGLSAVTKPFFFLATSWGVVLGLRFSDRVGKGVRTAPRDALIADSSAPEQRGRSFGFHRALDTAGAVLGVLGAALVVYLMQRGSLDLQRDTFRTIALVAAVPAFLAVAVLWRLVREVKPEVSTDGKVTANPRQPYPLRFKLLLGVMLLFTLGNSSDAFLILRAQNVGLSVPHILLLLAGFNLLYSLAAMPLGSLSDRVGRARVILAGWTIYALVYLGFALAGAPWQLALLFVGYGLYYAAAEGTVRALVADLIPSEQRGTAFGLSNTAMGIMAFPASLLAGVLWQAYGPRAPFLLGAGLAAAAAILLAAVLRPQTKAAQPV